jgi:two-component system sensor histidine kinase HydH
MTEDERPLSSPAPAETADRAPEDSEAEDRRRLERLQSQMIDPDKATDDLQPALARLLEMVHASTGRIYLTSPKDKTLRLAAHQGLRPEFISQVGTRAPHVGVTGRAAAEKKTVVLTDEDRQAADLKHLQDEGLQTVVAVPIMAGDELVGAINLADREVRQFSDQDLKRLEEAAGDVAVSIKLSRMKNTLDGQQERIQELNAALAQLETANQRLKSLQRSLLNEARQTAIAKFTSFIAHQVRNPLMTIGGFASRLDQMIPEDDPRKHYISVILEEVRVLELVLDESLKIFRAVKLDSTPLDPAEVLWEAMGRAMEEVGEVTGRLAQDLDPHVGTIVSDRDMLVRALCEVCENALEATRESGDIRLELKGGPDEVRFVVADTGRGMTQAELHRIFEPLYSTKELGTGLGMTIAQGVINRLGGRIEIESWPKKGTTVTVIVPRTHSQNGVTSFHPATEPAGPMT